MKKDKKKDKKDEGKKDEGKKAGEDKTDDSKLDKIIKKSFQKEMDLFLNGNIKKKDKKNDKDKKDDNDKKDDKDDYFKHVNDNLGPLLKYFTESLETEVKSKVKSEETEPHNLF